VGPFRRADGSERVDTGAWVSQLRDGFEFIIIDHPEVLDVVIPILPLLLAP
jgi:hypothetical protein